MKRLKAFTLIELLIGMIISAIIIAFAYGCYSLIYRQFLNYKTVREQINETISFNAVLNNDFTNSFVIWHREDKLIIQKQKDRPQNLEYSFADDYILRTDGEVRDTFHLSAKEISTTYLTEVERAPKILVQDFSFVAKVLDEMESFYFHKNYSAETALKTFIPPN